jgi:hypothetical protein
VFCGGADEEEEEEEEETLLFCGSSCAVWRQEGLQLRRETEATHQHGHTGKNKVANG